jgi:anti-anti-sigma regulatory factor
LAAETTPIALAAISEAATLAGDQPLAIDLSEATQVDREGVQALLLARRRWCPLALSGLSSELRRTFTKAGALDHFAVFDTLQDALVTMKREQDLRPGQLLDGRYKIDQRIGEGPLGSFYRATDRTTRRYVTIQVICPGIGPSPAQTLMEAAQTAAVLQYPLIARIFGAGQDDHVRYIATGYTSGRSVRQLIDAGDTATSLPPAQAVHIGLQVAQALEYAHGQKVVHGALRPENIILTEDNVVQVTHFGVGRLEIDKPLSELPAHVSPLDYLAPEQIQGHGNSPVSDLYALGTILYEMLTGRPPFAAMASEEDLISFQLLQPPVPPRRRNPGLSRALEHLVLKLLQKSPLDRPSTAGVVRQILAGLDPQRFPGTLLGRDVIRQKLHTHLERVAHGRSGLLVVHGQRGIGKSHLVLSVADQRVAGQPLLALHGELFSYEDARPYQVFVRALRHALLTLPAHRLSQLLDDLGELSRPLTALIPDLKPALSAFTPSHVEYESLEEAVCRTLRFMTTKGPVMLILDSLQWIDVASLQLLKRLARQQIPRLLIVVLYRTEALDLEHPLRQALDALESWIVDQIHVTPLGPVNVHQMTSTLGDTHNIPPDFSLWLSAETGGNPLHIEQLVRAYLEGPRETRHPHERATAVTLEDVILRRLERLSDSALTTLRQAAVLGHTFHFSTLHLALDQPERQVLADLSSALRDRFILGHPAEDHYSFSAPLIREVIYTEMLGGVRKRYHQRAARVLEKGGLSGVMDEKIDLLAHHFLHAGEHEKAVTYLARATRRARELCAYDSALNYINRALAVVEHLIQTAANEREREYRLRQRGDLWAARADLETTVAQRASQEG